MENNNIDQPQHGKALTVVLGLTVISALWSFLWAAINMSDYFSLSSDVQSLIPNFGLIGFISIAAGIVGIASVVGVWKWKRWGYLAFYLALILNIVASFMVAGFSAAIIAPVAWAAGFFSLFKNKMQYLR